MNIGELSIKNLKKALRLKERIAKLESELAALIGSSSPTPVAKRKGGMSAAGRKAVAAAQKKRWAKIKAEQKAKK